MNRQEIDPTAVLNEPLKGWRTEDLTNQLDERIAALLLRFDVHLVANCLNWDQSVLDLASCLVTVYAPWLEQTVTSVDPQTAWKLAIAVSTEFINGFKLKSEIPRPGAPSVYKGHELEINDTFRVFQERTDLTDEQISDILMDGPGDLSISDELRRLCDAFKQDILSGATSSSPELNRERNRAKKRANEDEESVCQLFFSRRGYLRKEVSLYLELVPNREDRKQKIALMCKAWRENRNLSWDVQAKKDKPKPKKSSLVNEILKIQLSKPLTEPK